MNKIALLWFRSDLRLQDNDALAWAIREGYAIVPYFHYSAQDAAWALGGASRWWLHHALADLQDQITAQGGQLLLGAPQETTEHALCRVVEEVGAQAVLWNRSYEPAQIQRDSRLKAHLQSEGYLAKSFNSAILAEPSRVLNKSGKPYRVFTPFWKSLAPQTVDATTVEIREARWHLPPRPSAAPRVCLQDYALLPTIPWDTGFATAWDVSRAGAMARLEGFHPHAARRYGALRDRPDLDSTSRLSPYLHFGQIGPRELVQHLRVGQEDTIESGVVRQLYWREFAHHLLYHFPHTTTQPLYEKYATFPWEENATYLRAWQRGETGFPIVDAGMRQLWATGWMHNRVRMIVGSFLVKHLLQPWQAGADWFWDTLVDASLPNNSLGWQWVAGCGADGAPYFRVFNPITQGQKFDETGDYVRRWCPELARVPLPYLHFPFDAPPLELRAAGVTLGREYPAPITTHADGRARALAALDRFKSSTEA